MQPINNPETRVVTVQTDTPMVAALKRAVVYAVLALLTGVAGLLATNMGASIREVLVTGFILAVPAFVRVMEGYLDTNRASEVSPTTTVGRAEEIAKAK